MAKGIYFKTVLGLMTMLGAVAVIHAAGVDAITNGDFENGLTDWTTSGNVDVITTANLSSQPFGFTASGGFALLSTNPGGLAPLSATTSDRQPMPNAASGGPNDRDGVNGDEFDRAHLSTTFQTTTPGFVCYTIGSFLTSEEDEDRIFDDIFEVRLDGVPVHQQSVNQSDGTSPFPDYERTSSVEIEIMGANNTNGSFFLNGGTESLDWQVPLGAGNHTIEFYVGDATDSLLDTGIIVDNIIFSTTDCGFPIPPTVTNRGTISGLVFKDLNANGVRDNGEPDDLSGFFSLLLNGNTINSASVDFIEGEYAFNAVAGQTYQVEFNEPFSADITTANVGGDEARDSDFDPTTGQTTPFTLVTTARRDVGIVDNENISVDRTFSTEPNTPLEGELFFDVASDNIQLNLIDNVDNGTLTLNPDGSFTYTPANGFTGTDTFTVTVTNTLDGATSGNRVVEIDVEPDNAEERFFFARSDRYSTGIDTPITVDADSGVLANDDGEGLTAAVDPNDPPFRGTINLNADGSFTYTPNAGQEGSDFFSYIATDQDGNTSSSFITINIQPLVINVPGTQFTDANTPLDIPELSVESPQPDGRIEIDLDVGDGTLTVTGGIAIAGVEGQQDEPRVRNNGSDRVTVIGTESQVNAVLETVVYQPNAGFVGKDELEIVAQQSTITTEAQVTIIVGATIDPGDNNANAGGGGDGDDDDATFQVGETTITVTAPSGVLTLFELSQLPGSPLVGEVPQNAVVDGDVFVQLIIAEGSQLNDITRIGDPDLIGQPITTSADVFGLTFTGESIDFTSGVQVKVCFLGIGNIFYRNAAGMPRVTQQLPTFLELPYTCAFIPNGGILVFFQTESGEIIGDAGPTDTSDQQASAAGAVSLSNCMVTTTTSALNLRDQPTTASTVLVRMRYDITLTATQRQGEWYFVDHIGTWGWAHSNFLTTDGDC